MSGVLDAAQVSCAVGRVAKGKWAKLGSRLMMNPSAPTPRDLLGANRRAANLGGHGHLLRLETYAAVDTRLYCPAHAKCAHGPRRRPSGAGGAASGRAARLDQ